MELNSKENTPEYIRDVYIPNLTVLYSILDTSVSILCYSEIARYKQVGGLNTLIKYMVGKRNEIKGIINDIAFNGTIRRRIDIKNLYHTILEYFGNRESYFEKILSKRKMLEIWMFDTKDTMLENVQKIHINDPIYMNISEIVSRIHLPIKDLIFNELKKWDINT